MNNFNDQLLKLNNTLSVNNKDDTTLPYVVFNIAGGSYAINSSAVVSIEKCGKITDVTNKAEGVRGISYYKEEAINLFDLRQLFGFCTQMEHIEHNINLQARIAEHIAYLDTIEVCVKDQKPFTGNLDHNKCKFGRWINEYVKDNSALSTSANQINSIVALHEAFHKKAAVIADNLLMKRIDEAEQDFKHIREISQKEIIEKLEELNNILISNVKEMVIVSKTGNKKSGFIVDSVENIEYITNIQPLPQATQASEFIKSFGLRKKDNGIILILEQEAFA